MSLGVLCKIGNRLRLQLSVAQIVFSQAAAKTGDNTIRVTVSVNADRSRAVLQIRGCAAQSSRNHHRAGRENLREEFVMNWMMPEVFPAVRFFGLDGQLRFKSLEKMTRCYTRSFTTTIQQESRPATRFLMPRAS
jgi:hypothetical protein